MVMIGRHDVLRKILADISEDLRHVQARSEEAAISMGVTAGLSESNARAERWPYMVGAMSATIDSAVRQIDALVRDLTPVPRRKGPRK